MLAGTQKQRATVQPAPGQDTQHTHTPPPITPTHLSPPHTYADKSGIQAPPQKGPSVSRPRLSPARFPFPILRIWAEDKVIQDAGVEKKHPRSRLRPAFLGGSPGSLHESSQSNCSGLRSTAVRRRARGCARQGQSMTDLGPTGPASPAADPGLSHA